MVSKLEGITAWTGILLPLEQEATVSLDMTTIIFDEGLREIY